MSEKYSIRRLVWAGPLTAAAALLVNLVFYAATKALGESYLMTLGGPSKPAIPMPVLSIVIATLAGAVGAILIFAFLLKISHVPLPPFLSISVAALLVSFGGPISLSSATTLQTKLLLCCMHILSAVVIVGGLILLCREK